MTDTRLEARKLSAGYGKNLVLEELELAVPTGQITAIVGANACGKSTLLKAMSRLIAPRNGEVVLDGQAIHRVPTRELARKLGVLPQSPVTPKASPSPIL